MKKFLLLMVCLALVVGCSKVEKAFEAPVMPEGFALVCNVDGDYTWRMDSGFTSLFMYNSKQEVIESAWSYKKFTEKPSKVYDTEKYTWEKCAN